MLANTERAFVSENPYDTEIDELLSDSDIAAQRDLHKKHLANIVTNIYTGLAFNIYKATDLLTQTLSKRQTDT